MSDGELRRLRRIEIDGLFSLYDHRIDLKTEDRVTLLHGVNGVGKTTVLGMIDALLRNHTSYFARIPFNRFRLDFMDGSSLELVSHTVDEKHRTATATMCVAGQSPDRCSIKLIPSEVEELAKEFGFLRLFDRESGSWIDIRTDEILSEQDVLTKYQSERGELKSPLVDFLNGVDAHFIKVQRLSRHAKPPRLNRYSRPGDRSPTATVLECSRDFQSRIEETMARYGLDAQLLDQTFPQRFMKFNEALDAKDLIDRLNSLKKITDDLMQMGLLSWAPEVPFDTADFESEDATPRRAMTLYAQDTEKKLSVLQELAVRTRMFLRHVNEKFRYKKIRVDQKVGLIAEDATQRVLPLDALSSGEQHELVLHYDLLFRVKPNTVVLIDEPELSLHVEWQKEFLPELIDIANVADFDAILATHSPFIVEDRDDLLVALGEPGAGA